MMEALEAAQLTELEKECLRLHGADASEDHRRLLAGMSEATEEGWARAHGMEAPAHPVIDFANADLDQLEGSPSVIAIFRKMRDLQPGTNHGGGRPKP